MMDKQRHLDISNKQSDITAKILKYLLGYGELWSNNYSYEDLLTRQFIPTVQICDKHAWKWFVGSWKNSDLRINKVLTKKKTKYDKHFQLNKS